MATPASGDPVKTAVTPGRLGVSSSRAPTVSAGVLPNRTWAAGRATQDIRMWMTCIGTDALASVAGRAAGKDCLPEALILWAAAQVTTHK